MGRASSSGGKLIETEESGLREHYHSWERLLMLLWPSELPWDFCNHLFGIDAN